MNGCLGHVSLQKLATVKVKGKDKPVVVYGLRSLGSTEQSVVEEQAAEEEIEMTEK